MCSPVAPAAAPFVALISTHVAARPSAHSAALAFARACASTRLQVEGWKEHLAEGRSMSVGKAFMGEKKDEE